jgi:hypothetical protein
MRSRFGTFEMWRDVPVQSAMRNNTAIVTPCFGNADPIVGMNWGLLGPAETGRPRLVSSQNYKNPCLAMVYCILLTAKKRWKYGPCDLTVRASLSKKPLDGLGTGPA